MKKICLVALSFVIIISAEAQTIKTKLDVAVKQLEKDAQLKHGLIGFSVIDAATGKPVYERNGEIGLAPASTQKIFTSIAAFEILGKGYRYKTSFGYPTDGFNYGADSTVGSLYDAIGIIASGDPTFGSWRFQTTTPAYIFSAVLRAFNDKGIKGPLNGIIIIENKFESKAIPDGWIWEDIGNYYGAGHYDLNWNENQYDLILKPSNKVGDSVRIVATRPLIGNHIVNELKTGTKGSGDNAYIYFQPLESYLFVRGTIPCCVDSFSISGSYPGFSLFMSSISDYMDNNKFPDLGQHYFHFAPYPDSVGKFTLLMDHYSPPLDSINYHFLKRSINLYGEALIRTIAREKAGIGSPEKGSELIKSFFDKIGIEKTALDIFDGSGLSPQNRVTANSLTKALRYAKGRPWFSSFYYALPEINGMKMKSGSIGGVRSYAGYQKAANGKEYIFSIIVNNYNGSSSELNKKLFRLLDQLKKG